MLHLFGRVVGRILAEAILEEYEIDERNLEGLKASLEKLLPKLMEFKADIENGKLRTVSNCPIHSIYEGWCENGCVPMAESFAHVINKNIKVKLIRRAPKEERCEFEFSP